MGRLEPQLVCFGDYLPRVAPILMTLRLGRISWWDLDVSKLTSYILIYANLVSQSSNTMPKQLEIHLPGVNATTRATLFGSITSIATYPPGDPIREGVIQGMLF